MYPVPPLASLCSVFSTEAWLPLLRATGPFDQALADLRAFDTAGVLTARIDALEADAAETAAAVLVGDAA